MNKLFDQHNVLFKMLLTKTEISIKIKRKLNEGGVFFNMKKLNKSIILLLTLVLIMGSFAACGGGTDNGGDGNGEAATEVKIGINYELTGPVASYGQSSVDGIMMAFDEICAGG